MPAFSTCWNNSRHTDGEAMVDEILELGFNELELSHGMTIAKLPGIQRAYEAGKFTCLGVHNYFPSPTEVMIDAPDAYEYTSFRPHERQRAMDMTFKTLEIAGQFKAKYLVLHMGSIPQMPHKKWTGKLTAMVKEGEQDSPAYVKQKLKCVKKREKHAELYYSRAIAAIEELLEKAKEYDVILAIESRSRYEDVPSDREMLALQKHFADEPHVRYWHDFGHIQLKHNLGLLDHADWLDKVQPYLYGAHVHDVEWPARDHRVPFTGTLDYDDLFTRFPDGCPMTWELSPTRKAEQIRDAFEIWKIKFPDR
ncbi:MAG: TIM barrel protein [Verrucomicrobiota bacterium JB023]|nr:TIM barrel protein [Verrucomicrobiota bacterium JB023]